MKSVTMALCLVLVVRPVEFHDASQSVRCGVSSGFRISATYFVDLSPEGWRLSIDDKGRASLHTVDGEQIFRIKGEALRDLRRAVLSEDPWSLASTYGQSSFLSFRQIDVCDKGRARSVTLYDVAGESPTSEEARFLRLWIRLRHLFSSTKAPDTRGEEAFLSKVK